MIISSQSRRHFRTIALALVFGALAAAAIPCRAADPVDLAAIAKSSLVTNTWLDTDIRQAIQDIS